MEGRPRREAAERDGDQLQTVKGLLRAAPDAGGRRSAAASRCRLRWQRHAAMPAAQAAAAPRWWPARLARSGFALKLKLTTSGIKGASLKGVAACGLAEKGIIAMTIAAASKPAVGILEFVPVGMLPSPTPSRRRSLLRSGGGERPVHSTETDDESADDVDVAEIWQRRRSLPTPLWNLRRLKKRRNSSRRTEEEEEVN